MIHLEEVVNFGIIMILKIRDKFIYTTLGQLNFFKWAIEHNVLEFIECNYTKLTTAMNLSNKESKKKK